MYLERSQTPDLTDTERELSNLLDAWDPIGVHAADSPQSATSGNYDDLVRPIMLRLAAGMGAAELAHNLTRLLATHYGFHGLSDATFLPEAEEFITWYRGSQQ